MNQPNEALTDQEVHRISQLIESLDRSTLDYLQVDAGGVKITISKGGAGLPAMASPAAPTAASVPAASFAAAPAASMTAPAPVATPAPRISTPPAQAGAADTPGTTSKLSPRRPVAMEAFCQPSGPSNSAMRRPARKLVSDALASLSISAQASAVTGARWRRRWFIRWYFP